MKIKDNIQLQIIASVVISLVISACIICNILFPKNSTNHQYKYTIVTPAAIYKFDTMLSDSIYENSNGTLVLIK